MLARAPYALPPLVAVPGTSRHHRRNADHAANRPAVFAGEPVPFDASAARRRSSRAPRLRRIVFLAAPVATSVAAVRMLLAVGAGSVRISAGRGGGMSVGPFLLPLLARLLRTLAVVASLDLLGRRAGDLEAKLVATHVHAHRLTAPQLPVQEHPRESAIQLALDGA